MRARGIDPGHLLALALLALPPAHAEVYRWTDAEGGLHFSDKPPSDGKAEQVQLPKAMANPGAAPGRPAVQSAKQVVMFSAEWCGYCRKARRYFQANGVAFRERDIEKDAAARREYERLGGNGLPLILVGDQRLSGFSEEGFSRLYEP